MNSKNKVQEIKDRFKALFEGKTEEQEIQYDEYMLMAAFLSEIEKIQKEKRVKRNRLAKLIKTTPSYLTQVFRGDKPLNFYTLAKIKRALDINFSVKAYYKNELINHAVNNRNDYQVSYSDLEGQLAYENDYVTIELSPGAITKSRPHQTDSSVKLSETSIEIK